MHSHPSNPSKGQPLHLLLVGQREEDYFIIQDLLNAKGSLISASLDQATGFVDAQVRLARKAYDLLLSSTNLPRTMPCKFFVNCACATRPSPACF